MSELLERVLHHEGFRREAYPDPLTGAEPYTFGHGLTWITEEESRRIVADRLIDLRTSLFATQPWLSSQPNEVVDILVEMAFQMGVAGVNGFTGMLGAIQSNDYRRAADEMLDSRWARQTPSRAKELSDLMRAFA